jgi:hypothetical protein
MRPCFSKQAEASGVETSSELPFPHEDFEKRTISFFY